MHVYTYYTRYFLKLAFMVSADDNVAISKIFNTVKEYVIYQSYNLFFYRTYLKKNCTEQIKFKQINSASNSIPHHFSFTKMEILNLDYKVLIDDY